ncbi:MAG TPA: hypothetical protein VN952_00230, partial [Chthoniobacterales bacterium]|nr:hypothetical protein [Chthoniobacterales bacterium]
RATIDIPLQTLWQSLPEGLAQDNTSLDPKRRIQIPRKEVGINDLDHTGTVSLYVVRAVCPDIFAAPVPAADNRSLKFPLPAWERLRNVEVLEVKTAPDAAPESVKPQPDRPIVEKPDSPMQGPKEQTDQHQTDEGENLSDKHQEPATTNGETQPSETHSNGTERSQSIRIALSPILRHLPPELNRTALHDVAGSNSEIELPFDLIEPQLPNGRVTVPLSIFLEALPETIRNAFTEVDQSTQVPIPLQEIFRHLPSDALPLRADQEEDEVGDPIDTPFTTTAREDAERFRNAASTVEKSDQESAQPELGRSFAQSEKTEAPSDTPEPVILAPEPEISTAAAAKTEPNFSALQTVFLTDERLDLPTIIDKISALPGLQTALLHTADGRRLTGAIGDDQFERTVLTLFPVLFGEVKTKLDERACPGLETLTFCWRQEQISIFSDGRLCLSVRHSRRPFKPGVREKLSLILSRLAEALSPSEI